jgi:hypothetical protein
VKAKLHLKNGCRIICKIELKIFILFFNIPNSHRGVGVVPYGPEAASLAAASCRGEVSTKTEVPPYRTTTGPNSEFVYPPCPVECLPNEMPAL